MNYLKGESRRLPDEQIRRRSKQITIESKSLERKKNKSRTKDSDRLGGRTTFGLSRLVSRAIEEEIKQVSLTKKRPSFLQATKRLKVCGGIRGKSSLPTTQVNFSFSSRSSFLPLPLPLFFASAMKRSEVTGREAEGLEALSLLLPHAVPKLFESI